MENDAARAREPQQLNPKSSSEEVQAEERTQHIKSKTDKVGQSVSTKDPSGWIPRYEGSA